MKSINLTTLIEKYKGVFSSAVLSLIIHISMFLVIPTFSFIIIDKLEDSKGQILTVEMINAEGKASETAENLKPREIGSLEERKAEGKKAGKVKGKKTALAPEAKLKTVANSEADLMEDEKPEPKPLPEAVPPVEEEKDGEPINQVPGEKSEVPEHSINDPFSMERGKGTGDDRSEMKVEAKAVPAQMQNTDVVQSIESFAEQKEEQGSAVGEKETAAQLFAPSEKEENVIQTAADEEIKDNQIVAGIESGMEKKEPFAEPEPRIPTPEQPAPVVGVTGVRDVEIKADVQKQNIASEESPESKEVKVVKKATDKSDSVPAGIVQPEVPAATHWQDLNVPEKKNESVNDVEQKVEVEKKREDQKYDEHRIAKDEYRPSADIHSVPEPDKKIEKMKVAEKREESAKIVEQNVESPAKKKKRIIPFHKMVEPEKETKIGIPLGRPFVQITAPARGKISGRVQSVSGRAQGKGVTRVTLSVNGENTIVPVQNGLFLLDTALRDGKNTISGTVWDMDGKSASDTVMVEVLPAKNSFKLSIDEPGGDIESPVAMVRGKVEDATVGIVRLILNGEIVEAAVEDGYFEKMVLFKERENTLVAEAANSAGLTARSEPLKVVVKSPLVADILIRLVWNDTEVELHPGISRKERSHLEDERAPWKGVNIVELVSAAEGYGEKIFSVREADGAYSLKVSGGRGTDCKLVVSLNSSKRRVRVFEKRLTEGEEWVVGRFLMLEGVFWDEDEWFSGKIEGSDSMIKYNSLEGVTWKELK